jgi:hypothetical protein
MSARKLSLVLVTDWLVRGGWGKVFYLHSAKRLIQFLVTIENTSVLLFFGL